MPLPEPLVPSAAHPSEHSPRKRPRLGSELAVRPLRESAVNPHYVERGNSLTGSGSGRKPLSLAVRYSETEADVYDAMQAETVQITGHGGDEIEAYLARPLDRGPHGAVVVIHHMPGYDRQTKEITRRFAVEGYLALCPNLYSREAPGASPDDAAAAVRAAGGVPDERLVGDVAGAARYLRALSSSNGKVATIGYCSGGRQSFLAACSLELDAAVDCYGAFVVGSPPNSSPT